jgi:hypothetical protein
MVIRIKVNPENFDDAEPYGSVDGLFQGRRGLYAYVELGEEMDYIPQPGDNPRTEYRIFRTCNAFFATTIEQLDAGEFDGEMLNVTVIIYC